MRGEVHATAGPRPRSYSVSALFGYGFRPFFLAVGAVAALLIPWWAAFITWDIPLGTD